MGNLLELKVWGDFASFTRPEFKVERVSYDVLPPSAARGILDAVFWKPEVAWRIHEIHVLRPIRRFSILRNEIGSVQSDRAARSWKAPGDGYFADEDRQQRHTLGLCDVAYMIRAELVLRPHADAPIAKYRDQFRRRIAYGQCHHQPCFGHREFVAYFGEPDGTEQPIDLTEPLGLMLFDVDFVPDARGPMQYYTHDSEGAIVVKGRAQPRFFRATLQQGILHVPIHLYETRS
jgi:CRISPR-associated protein Cas5d